MANSETAMVTASNSSGTADKVRKQYEPSVNRALVSQSSTLLFAAAAIGIVLGFAMFGLEGGRQGVLAIGGMLDAQIPVGSARIIFMLDILFPIFFGSGFVLLATGLQSRGNRPLVRVLLTLIALAVTSDFIENALVYKGLIGEGAIEYRWPFTVVKYAGLAFAAVLISSILLRNVKLGEATYILTRYAFPFAIAVMVSGVGGEVVRDLVAASFPISLLILAFYTQNLSVQES